MNPREHRARFSESDRDRARERILAIIRADSRITGVAFVGSAAIDALDEWSDLDITCGVRSDTRPIDLLNDVTRSIAGEYQIVDHFDVTRGSAIYRVILFANALELDLSAAPGEEFAQLGPHFRLLEGKAHERSSFPAPSTRDPIGWGWHHLLHANAALNRERPWQALFWINGLRDRLITLMLIRHGLRSAEARGAHELPADELAPLEETIACSSARDELRRSLHVLKSLYIAEVAQHQPELAAPLEATIACVIGRAGEYPST